MQNSNSNAGADAQQSTDAEVPTSGSHIAKPLVSGSFSYNDMLGFAHYLRNGLTNMEYCQKEHEEHLEYWCLNYR